MPGAGWSQPKPWHWRCLFRWWLDRWHELQGRWTAKDWLIWALKHAKPHGLEYEVADFYVSHIKAGVHPSIAANWACDEWDL